MAELKLDLSFTILRLAIFLENVSIAFITVEFVVK